MRTWFWILLGICCVESTLLIFLVVKGFGVNTDVLSVSIPAMATIIAIYLSKQKEAVMQIQAKQREKKAEFYSRLSYVLIQSYKVPGQKSNSKYKKSFDDVISDLRDCLAEGLVWAPNEFILAWQNYIKSQPDPSKTYCDEDLIISMRSMAKLVFVIRQDLGYDRGALKNTEVLSGIIKDFNGLDDQINSLP